MWGEWDTRNIFLMNWKMFILFCSLMGGAQLPLNLWQSRRGRFLCLQFVVNLLKTLFNHLFLSDSLLKPPTPFVCVKGKCFIDERACVWDCSCCCGPGPADETFICAADSSECSAVTQRSIALIRSSACEPLKFHRLIGSDGRFHVCRWCLRCLLRKDACRAVQRQTAT